LQLGHLIATMPDLTAAGPLSSDALTWLARADVLVSQIQPRDIPELRAAASMLHASSARGMQAGIIAMLVHRALAFAEACAPAPLQGTFIHVGDQFEALIAVKKVLDRAKRHFLLVDPYMDANALADFAIQAPEGISVRLLADHQWVKPGLQPAAEAWVEQHGSKRPWT
jgi:hypothetical protein